MKQNIKWFLLCIIPFLFSGCVDQKQVELDEQFRDYIRKEYSISLASNATIGKCNSKCDYYGYYPLKNDLTYMVQISKTGDQYEVSYDEESVSMRKELYDYLSSQRGNDFVKNYLAFYDNGDHGHMIHTSITRNQLKYIIYYDSKMDMDKEIEKDYLILQKAGSILSSKTNYKINEMEVFYIDDPLLKKKNWLLNVDIDADDYTNAPNYLDGDNKAFTSKFTYHFRISDYKNDRDLSTLSLDEFKTMVNQNLEKN